MLNLDRWFVLALIGHNYPLSTGLLWNQETDHFMITSCLQIQLYRMYLLLIINKKKSSPLNTHVCFLLCPFSSVCIFSRFIWQTIMIFQNKKWQTIMLILLLPSGVSAWRLTPFQLGLPFGRSSLANHGFNSGSNLNLTQLDIIYCSCCFTRHKI